ncbi:hypothetical protein BH09VER1_BH09VER1_00920 [soil metagenome]
MIANALLRVENTVGLPPAPFEQPRSDLAFWVLELSPYEPELKTQCEEIMNRLALHQDLIKDLAARNLRIVLHLAIDNPAHQPFQISVNLLRIAADFHADLEIYQWPSDV